MNNFRTKRNHGGSYIIHGLSSYREADEVNDMRY